MRSARRDGSIAGAGTKKAQTISYPAPDEGPRRHDSGPLEPHVIVLFGATGDLAKRKLLPGMAYLVQSALAPEIRVVGTSLENLSDDEFRNLTKEAVDSFGTHKLTDEQWASFAKRVTYVPQGAGPDALAAAVAAAEQELEAHVDHAAGAATQVRRLHYLSVPPKAARAVITML